jgi:hypothetical protein
MSTGTTSWHFINIDKQSVGCMMPLADIKANCTGSLAHSSLARGIFSNNEFVQDRCLVISTTSGHGKQWASRSYIFESQWILYQIKAGNWAACAFSRASLVAAIGPRCSCATSLTQHSDVTSFHVSGLAAHLWRLPDFGYHLLKSGFSLYPRVSLLVLLVPRIVSPGRGLPLVPMYARVLRRQGQGR